MSEQQVAFGAPQQPHSPRLAPGVAQQVAPAGQLLATSHLTGPPPRPLGAAHAVSAQPSSTTTSALTKQEHRENAATTIETGAERDGPRGDDAWRARDGRDRTL